MFFAVCLLALGGGQGEANVAGEGRRQGVDGVSLVVVRWLVSRCWCRESL